MGAAVGVAGAETWRAVAPRRRSAPASILQPTGSVASDVTPQSSAPATTERKAIGPAGSFAGEWNARNTVLVIDQTGYGILAWRLDRQCGPAPPPCDIVIGDSVVGGGHATLVMRATGHTTGTGKVLTTTVPSEVPLGRFTARLDRASDLLHLSVRLLVNYSLCGASSTGECGG